MLSLKSAITKRILNYFFINPHEKLYVNELSRKLSLDKRNLVKKIKELERKGLLTHEARGNLKLYAINTLYPLYKEYRKIILMTTGFEEQLRSVLGSLDGISEAYIYGSYAKDAMNEHSDIDVLIVGTINVIIAQKHINVLQNNLDREINVTVMDEKDFRRRIKEKDPFIGSVLKQRHIKVL